MKPISRRSFISAGTITGLGAFAGITSCNNSVEAGPINKPRNHPLDGITKENIKITDMKVTLLSCELPPENNGTWIGSRRDINAGKQTAFL
jgi:hypothetical protein